MLFFYLSKILAFVFSPIIWLFTLLVFALKTKRPKTKNTLIATTLILFFVFGNSFILNEVNSHWETPPIADSNLKTKYTYAIVLGGLSYYDFQLNRIHFHKSSDRIFHAIRLLKEKKVEKILISGGSGSIAKPYELEANLLKEYLLKIGIADTLIVTENKSKNTYENAIYTKEILQKQNKFSNSRLLLITSGYHMKRAKACFKKQGFLFDTYSVDGRSGERKYYPDNLLIPDVGNLLGWHVLIHEFLGYSIYKVTGKI
jgi:uncharacterized SAM-binding protein YcdF (DUF218 family)